MAGKISFVASSRVGSNPYFRINYYGSTDEPPTGRQLGIGGSVESRQRIYAGSLSEGVSGVRATEPISGQHRPKLRCRHCCPQLSD